MATVWVKRVNIGYPPYPKNHRPETFG
jgi:hypothetical protein